MVKSFDELYRKGSLVWDNCKQDVEFEKEMEDLFLKHKFFEVIGERLLDTVGLKLDDIFKRDDAGRLKSLYKFLPVEELAFESDDVFGIGFDADSKIDKGYTHRSLAPSLHFAMAHGASKCVKVLLFMATRNRTCQQLLNHKPSSDKFYYGDKKALQFFMQPEIFGKFPEETSVEIVKTLLEHGANPYEKGEHIGSDNEPAIVKEAVYMQKPKLAAVLSEGCRAWDKDHPVRTKTLQSLSVLGQLIPVRRVQRHNTKANNNNQTRQNVG